MNILAQLVSNLDYFYIPYKKLKKSIFNIHKCNCKDCEGCNFEEGCAQPEDEDTTEEINKAINRIKWLISDDDYIYDCDIDCDYDIDDEDEDEDECFGEDYLLDEEP